MDRPLRPGTTPRGGLRARGQRGRREAGAWHLGPEGVTGEPFRTHCGRGVAPQAAVGTAKEGRAVGAGHRAGRSPPLGGCVCQRILNNTLVSSPLRLRGLRVSHLRPTVTAPRLVAPESLPVAVLRDHQPVVCPLDVTRHQTPPRAPPPHGLPRTEVLVWAPARPHVSRLLRPELGLVSAPDRGTAATASQLVLIGVGQLQSGICTKTPINTRPHCRLRVWPKLQPQRWSFCEQRTARGCASPRAPR